MLLHSSGLAGQQCGELGEHLGRTLEKVRMIEVRAAVQDDQERTLAYFTEIEPRPRHSQPCLPRRGRF